MREIFAIKTLLHNRRYKMEPTSKTNQQFVYLLNMMHIYVVAKLLTFFLRVFWIFYMGFKFCVVIFAGP